MKSIVAGGRFSLVAPSGIPESARWALLGLLAVAALGFSGAAFAACGTVSASVHPVQANAGVHTGVHSASSSGGGASMPSSCPSTSAGGGSVHAPVVASGLANLHGVSGAPKLVRRTSQTAAHTNALHIGTTNGNTVKPRT